MLTLAGFWQDFGMIETLGWIGAILLAVQGIPQAFACIKQGHSNGLNSAFLWAWFGGELFLIPLILTTGSMALMLNYLVNLVVVGIILRYKYFPKTT